MEVFTERELLAALSLLQVFSDPKASAERALALQNKINELGNVQEMRRRNSVERAELDADRARLNAQRADLAKAGEVLSDREAALLEGTKTLAQQVLALQHRKEDLLKQGNALAVRESAMEEFEGRLRARELKAVGVAADAKALRN